MKDILISLALLLVGVSSVSAQSLAELAREERERRESLGRTETETYDDAALAARRRATPPSMLSSGTAGGATETGDAAESGEESLQLEETEEEDPTQTQAYWRDRKAAIDRRIAGIEAQLNEPGFASDPANLMRRTQLERQLAQARADLAALRAEARSEGVPPGWVR